MYGKVKSLSPLSQCDWRDKTSKAWREAESESQLAGVARALEIVSRTFCRFVIIEILRHAYFEYILDIGLVV